MEIPQSVHEKVHSVESQWHYTIMTKYGYKTEVRERKGLVRSYNYSSSNDCKDITCSTGVNGDHWFTRSECGGWAGGYAGELEDYLRSITETK